MFRWLELFTRTLILSILVDPTSGCSSSLFCGCVSHQAKCETSKSESPDDTSGKKIEKKLSVKSRIKLARTSLIDCNENVH